MITINDVKDFIETAASDFNDNQIQNCIDIALLRFQAIKKVSPENNPIDKKILVLLAVSELANSVNLYWKGQDKTNIIKTKDVIAEVERLLKVSSSMPIGFINIEV
ncbi:MAG: hypothetical protein NZZ41_03290 [Candidatus Dojkabacteria bacterium]|nr:hypothetical protein [Candidatus Dojkabacteria bacterium]